MQAYKLDCIIAPGLSLPAYTHGASKDLTSSASYTMLFNLLNFPAGTVPVTTVRPEEAQVKRDVKKDMWEAKAAKVDENSEGLPVGGEMKWLAFNFYSTSGFLSISR